MRKISLSSARIFFISIPAIIFFIGFSVIHVTHTFSTSHLSKRDFTRVNDEGAVGIRITYLNPIQKVDDEELVFEVRMNTHSVDLDNYKMEKLTVLKDDKGNSYKPLGWFNPGGGGHHRFGIIKFSSRDSKGKNVIEKNTKYITIIIKDVDNIKERVFQWKLPL